MGEAMAEYGVFAHAKARALLEVVRLAFEDGIGFESSEIAESRHGGEHLPEDMDVSADGNARVKARSNKDAPVPHPPQRATHTGSSSRLVPGGPCMWCGVTSTPQWRRPRGTNKLLCNACGIFFTRYGKLPDRTQHAHAHSGSAKGGASRATTGPASDTATGRALQSTDQQHEVGAAHVGSDDEPPLTSGSEHLQRPRLVRQRSAPQQQLARSNSLAGASPYKRKDAPQPEVELLHCTEDSVGSFAEDGAAPPAMAPLGGLTQHLIPPGIGLMLTDVRAMHAAGPLSLQLHVGAGGGGGDAAEPVAGALAGPHTSSALLAVAPLDLGLPRFGVHQQLRGLHQLQPLVGLPPLPPLPPLLLTDSAMALPCSAAAGGGSALAAPLPSSVLPPGLMGRPFTLPPGLLPHGAAMLDPHPPPRSLYARPPKRQERLPTGDSEDSNASTDSHAATLHAASHDDDDGGTALLGSSIGSSRGGQGPGLSCSPSSSGQPFPPSSLFALPANLALLPGVPGAATAGALALPPAATSGGSGLGCLPAGLIASSALPWVAQPPAGIPGQEQLDAGPVILLQTRRSKGPRSRASSVTLSSSTQS